ncbi:MAG: phosphoribosylglycinamide formyltransferase [Saprospiraceae bacterium]
MNHIAIFASGTGSNAKKIIEHFQSNPSIKVSLLVSNKATAPVLNFAQEHGIDQCVIDRASFYDTTAILSVLKKKRINFIVLAGFLWLIPPYLVEAFKGRMVNIHPALLPKYGGKGMFGKHVHQAVKAAGETESGITIHYVNEHYDEGDIIFQATCPISATATPEDIAKKVLTLEHRHFATVIEQLLVSQ